LCATKIQYTLQNIQVYIVYTQLYARIVILLIRVKHLHVRIISQRGKLCANLTSLSLTFLLKYMCQVLKMIVHVFVGIDIAYFCEFSIIFCNCSYNVVSCVFLLDFVIVPTAWYLMFFVLLLLNITFVFVYVFGT